MDVRAANAEKKWLACLGCGTKMWTDRCHRMCKKCRRRHEAQPPPRQAAHVEVRDIKEGGDGHDLLECVTAILCHARDYGVRYELPCRLNEED